jgi:hypothetical protein
MLIGSRDTQRNPGPTNARRPKSLPEHALHDRIVGAQSITLQPFAA